MRGQYVSHILLDGDENSGSWVFRSTREAESPYSPKKPLLGYTQSGGELGLRGTAASASRIGTTRGIRLTVEAPSTVLWLPERFCGVLSYQPTDPLLVFPR
jgi:hypothetical protein